jgi:tRNA-specific 2-thiouridylase
VRYRQRPQACVLEDVSEDRISLSFEQSQWAVTPGQSVVLYDGEVCLGGAIIDSSDTLDDRSTQRRTTGSEGAQTA